MQPSHSACVPPLTPHPAVSSIWQGHIAIGFGIGMFAGLSGDNQPHRHLAHQLSFSMDDNPIQVIADTRHYQASGLFIPAGISHCVLPQRCYSIYLDTTHPLSRRLLNRFAQPATIYILPDDVSQLLQQLFQAASSMQAALEQLMIQLPISPQSSLPVQPVIPALPAQFQQILQQLYEGALRADIPDRHTLAAQVHLSPSRFSHWFAQHSGIPLRTYRKWLRLICSLQYLQQAQLTDIAHQARFADQAHFSRTCMHMFGVRPSDLQGISHIKLITTLAAR